MWGFYLLHVRRMVGDEVRRGRTRFTLALGLAAIFALSFLLAPDSRSRFLATSVALAGAFCFFHERGDLLRAGYMLLLGAAVEFAGVWSGQWSSADAPAGDVPLWFAPMWAAVGLFAGRLEQLPLVVFMSALQFLRLRPFGRALAMMAGEATALRPTPRRPEREDMSDPQSVAAFDGQGTPDGALRSGYQFNALVLSALLPPGGELLDLGCGSGRFLTHLAERRPDVAITGLDLSPAMIERGRENVKAAGLEGRVRLIVGDMTAFSRLAPGRVDVISSMFSLHHLPDFERLESCLAEVAAVRAGTGCAVWISDHARPRNARTARRFPEFFTPQAPPEFRKDSANSLLASFSCEELSGRLDRAVGGWHHRNANLPFFQIHWLPAMKELATCDHAHLGPSACPAARDFLYPLKVRLRTTPCPIYGSCKGGVS
jgi:SAM-dependent methyltransferase